MATDSFKVKKSLNIEPIAGASPSAEGDIVYDDTANAIKYNNGSARTVANLDESQTLTNKTLTSPTVNTPTVDIMTLDGQASAPSNPSSGYFKLYADDTTGKLKILNSAGTATTVGSGGGGGRNYLDSNPDAEINATTDWATYADAAATSPVDGTGGSPSSTFTASSSSPLRGTYSFLWTKSANDRQGEGFSYAFTIDPADKGKVLQISFEYAIASGTYADDDMVVYIYDVTNAALIQPAPYKIKNHSLAAEKWFGEFQTSTSSSSYRLIVHTSSTSASAYTLKFDNFIVGPQAKLYGSPINDPVSFTPTGSWVSNTTYSGQWYRHGKYATIEYYWTTSGAPTSASLTLNMPSGLTIDMTEISTLYGNRQIGVGNVNDSGTDEYIAVAYATSSTVISVFAPRAITIGSGTYSDFPAVTQAIPQTWANGDSGRIKITVPIVGWSSGVAMSNDASTRVVAMRAEGSTTPTGSFSIGGAIVFPATPLFDTHGGYSTSTGKYTVQVPGKYRANFGLRFHGTATSSSYVAPYIYKNSSISAYNLQPVITQTGGTLAGANITSIVDCVAGDTIEPRIDTNVTSPTHSAYAAGSYFEVEMLSGPAQVAASESVSARYEVSAAGSYANSGSPIIDFASKTYDSHNAVTTGASWKFTAPISGVYSVSFKILADSYAWTAGNFLEVRLQKNGSGVYAVGDRDDMQASVTGYFGRGITTNIRLLAGEYISPQITHNRTGGSIGLLTSSYSYIDITRVGNY